MSDFNIDTNAPADRHVVINKQRYSVVGMTRSIQIAARAKQTEAAELDKQQQSANGNRAELDERSAKLMIELATMRLRPIGDAEPAEALLKRLWESDELEADRWLGPLVEYLYGEETQPVPPA